MLSAQHAYPSEYAGLGRTWSGWAAGAVSVLLVAGVATTDLLTMNVNLSILYTLPILLAARMRSRVGVWQLALVLVALTYVGYFWGPRAAPEAEGWRAMVWNYRMANRTLAAVTILLVAGMVHFWIGLRVSGARPQWSVVGMDPEQETVGQILRSFEVLGAALICGLIMLCIGLTDVLSPGEFNLPILYAVPLMLCGAVRSRSLLWSILPFLLVLTLVGFVAGPRSDANETFFQSLVTNRFLAASAQVALALLVHVWIGEKNLESFPAHV